LPNKSDIFTVTPITLRHLAGSPARTPLRVSLEWSLFIRGCPITPAEVPWSLFTPRLVRLHWPPAIPLPPEIKEAAVVALVGMLRAELRKNTS
jgi:hypothetical protein